MIASSLSDWAELVEALFFTSGPEHEEGPPFDRLRANGL
jgi:hypothetical protein